jgi:hypothetical protein
MKDLNSRHLLNLRKNIILKLYFFVFKSEIEDRNNQTLIIQCYSYDTESASLLSNFTKNNNSDKRLFKSFKTFLENRKIADDFLGQIQIPLKVDII